MRNKDELHRENDALRERLSRLSEASLRINETLDFDTVLTRFCRKCSTAHGG